MTLLALLVVVLAAALLFDLLNGFHDAANAIATSVSTGAMSLPAAIVVSSLFNLFGALSGKAIATYIAGGIAADHAHTTPQVVLGALLGASAWNLLTWWYGLPSSSSHALIGGLCGGIIAHTGRFGAVAWKGVAVKVLIPLVVAPLTGFTLALGIMVALFWCLRGARPAVVNRSSRALLPISACALSFAHGQNDAQKTMGVMAMALAAYVAAVHGNVPGWMASRAWVLPHGGSSIPLWVVVACAMAMAAGTAMGGRRIIKTMGTRISRIDPLQGFVAQASGTVVILCASRIGLPVSTTQNISSAILGSGASPRLSSVRWSVVEQILVAWALTLPAAGAAGYVLTALCERLFATAA